MNIVKKPLSKKLIELLYITKELRGEIPKVKNPLLTIFQLKKLKER